MNYAFCICAFAASCNFSYPNRPLNQDSRLSVENLGPSSSIFLVLALINWRGVRLERFIPRHPPSCTMHHPPSRPDLGVVVAALFRPCPWPCLFSHGSVMDLCGRRRLKQTLPFDSVRGKKKEGKYNQVI